VSIFFRAPMTAMLQGSGEEINFRRSGIPSVKAYDVPPPRRGPLAVGLSRFATDASEGFTENPLDPENLTKATLTRQRSHIDGQLKRSTALAENRRQSSTVVVDSHPGSPTSPAIPWRADSPFPRQGSTVTRGSPTVVPRGSSFTRQPSQTIPGNGDSTINRRLSIARPDPRADDTVPRMTSVTFANTVTRTDSMPYDTSGAAATQSRPYNGSAAATRSQSAPYTSATVASRLGGMDGAAPMTATAVAAQYPVPWIQEVATVGSSQGVPASNGGSSNPGAVTMGRVRPRESPLMRSVTELPTFGNAHQRSSTPDGLRGADGSMPAPTLATRTASATTVPWVEEPRKGPIAVAPTASKRGTTAHRTTHKAVNDGLLDPAQAALDRRKGGKAHTQWHEVLGPELLAGTKRLPTASVCDQAAFLALYFAAGSSPPCIDFAKTMVAAYPSLLARGLEVILVSGDKTQERFDKHYAGMPWKAVPWNTTLYLIDERYGVMGIPKLIVLYPDGSVATSYGAQLVREDITGAKLIDAVWENTDEAVIESGEEAPRQRRRDKVRDECSVM